MKLRTFFTEDNKTFSMTRMVTFLTTIVVLFIMILSTLTQIPIDYYGLSALMGVVVSGKIVQKFKEHRNNRNNIDNPDDIEPDV